MAYPHRRIERCRAMNPEVVYPSGPGRLRGDPTTSRRLAAGVGAYTLLPPPPIAVRGIGIDDETMEV